MKSFFKDLGDPDKRYFFLLAAVVISLPINMNFNALWISIFSLNAIVSFKKKNFETDISSLVLYGFYILFFLSSAFSLLYTENMDSGFIKVQTKLSFLFIPLAFASNLKNLKKAQIQWLLRSLIISVLACTIFCYLESAVKAFSSNDFSQLYDSRLSDPLMHRAYFSIFLGLATLFWWEDKGFLRKLRIPSLSLFVVTIILLQGRINILAFLLVSAVIIIVKYAKVFSGTQKIMGLVISSVLIFSYSFLPEKYNRFNQPLTLEYNLADPANESFTGLTIRLAIWDIAIPLIKENSLTGLGVGDSKDALENKYEELNFQIGKRKKFNCHNQFLESTLASGILSLIALFGILIIYLILSYQYKSIFLAGLVIFIFISMITESLLERHWGISILCIVAPLYMSFVRKKD